MKTKFPVKLLSLHCAIAFASMGTSTAFAEEVVAADSDNVDEIIVTAQKRKESINDVPMSITAITGDQLAERGIEDVGDLQKVVSGFRYTESYTGTPVYYIRGVGFNEASLGALPNVAVYVDEVPVTFPVMTGGVALDLERVEVLKGPQGTLFGQSSTGGAVNYIAAKPTSTFKSAITVGYGSFDDKTVEGYINGPLAENLNARFAFKAQKSGSWQESQTTGTGLGQKDKTNGRVLLDWKPTDKLKIGLNFTNTQDRSELQAGQYSGFSYINPAPGVVALIPANINTAITTQPTASDNRSADWGPDRPHQNNELNQLSLRADYDLSEGKQLTYIVSHADYSMKRLSDTDGVNVKNFQIKTAGDISAMTHELRLSGNAFAEKGKWLVGANYEDSTVDQLDKLDFNVSNSYRFVALGGPPFLTTDNQTHQEFTNKSLFGAFDYALTDTLSGHVSARRSKNSDKFSGCTKDSGAGDLAGAYNAFLAVVGNPTTIAPGGCITSISGTSFGTLGFGSVTQSLEESNTSWRLGMDWKPDNQSLYYANVSKGYKGGSFPNLSASDISQLAPVVQESVIAYETGFKRSFKEQKLQLNGAVFYYDYTNKQVRGRVAVPLFGTLERLINVPESEVKGLELQAIWKFSPGWTANINGTYLNTKITKNNAVIDDFGTTGTFEGEPFPNTPKLQANADLEYAWGLSNGYAAFVGGNVTYQDDTYNGFGQNERLKINGYSTLDLRAGVDSPDGKWRATVWGRNVTDKYFWINQTRVGDTIVKIAGQPRAFGANFTYRFK